MAMAVDSRQQAPFNTMGYDALRYTSPQFTNPWVSAPAHSHGQMYPTSLPAASTAVGSDPHRYVAQAPSVSSAAAAAYSGAPVSGPLATGILQVDPELFLEQSGLQFAQEGMSVSRPYGAQYPTTANASTGGSYPPTSAPQYSTDSLQRGAGHYGYQQVDRRTSHPLVEPNTSTLAGGDTLEDNKLRQSSLIDFTNRLNSASDAERQSFSDALDASRGMVAMSQSDITPRNIYGTQGSSRSSTDSYGFPSAHSSHSSISSASTYPSSYYAGSVSDASVGGYSSASESVDMPNRTLPRPGGLVGGAMPPAPQSMMGQFSSKVSSSSQKKHKCKICDKRFTRPSSLQTHMYSHTGEKPFACDVDGCGRHFSVVSNLRRHRKVHKGEGHDHPSPDDDE